MPPDDNSLPDNAKPIGPNLAKFFYEQDAAWGVISHAFWKGGKILCQTCPPKHFSNNDLIFPTLFLYRHYFELGLKSLIEGTTHFAQSTSNSVPKVHNLKPLAEELGRRLKPYGLSRDERIDGPSEMALLTSWASRFDEFDPASMRFRYPTDPKGTAHSYPDLTELFGVRSPADLEITMDRLKKAMDYIAEIIAGIIDCQAT